MEKLIIIKNYDYKQMSNKIGNPFTRTTILDYNTNSQSVSNGPTFGRDARDNMDQIRQNRIFQNPFEKSGQQNLFSHKKHVSQQKSIRNNNKYNGTFLPLSRYQTRLKLRQIDKQLWKRQLQQQQRYKLKHYGPDALKYNSFNSDNNLYSHYYSRAQRQKQIINSSQNIQESFASIRKNDRKMDNFNSLSRQQYSEKQLKFFKKEPAPKNPDSITSIVNKNNLNNNQQVMQKNKYKSENIYSPKRQMNSRWQNGTSYKDIENLQSKIQYKRKQTAFFNSGSQYFEGSFNGRAKVQDHGYSRDLQIQKNLHENTQGKYQQFDDQKQYLAMMNNRIYGSDFGDQYVKSISQKINKLQNKKQELTEIDYKKKGSTMSYGSNFEKDKEKYNFYQSDYINQDEKQNKKKGPLNAMKFSSSSFDSDGPRSGTSRNNQMKRTQQSILYQGKQYFRIDFQN